MKNNLKKIKSPSAKGQKGFNTKGLVGQTKRFSNILYE
jgi:hypothetical protein